MRRLIAAGVREEAIRLRRENALGVRAIARRTGLSVGTVSQLVAALALDADTVRGRQRRAAAATNAARWPTPRGPDTTLRGDRRS